MLDVALIVFRVPKKLRMGIRKTEFCYGSLDWDRFGLVVRYSSPMVCDCQSCKRDETHRHSQNNQVPLHLFVHPDSPKFAAIIFRIFLPENGPCKTNYFLNMMSFPNDMMAITKTHNISNIFRLTNDRFWGLCTRIDFGAPRRHRLGGGNGSDQLHDQGSKLRSVACPRARSERENGVNKNVQ